MNLKKKKFYQDKDKAENRIHVKKLELSVKENLLYRKAKTLQTQWNTKLETNLKELKDELTKLKTKSSSDIKTVETSIQTDECYFNNEAINYSNSKNTQELQMIIQDQQLRIEKLTVRVMSLSQQIEAQFSKNLINEVSGPTTQTQCLPKNICESSSTDDIIQDAKNRLKRLKEETIKADQRYFNSIVSLPL